MSKIHTELLQHRGVVLRVFLVACHRHVRPGASLAHAAAGARGRASARPASEMRRHGAFSRKGRREAPRAGCNRRRRSRADVHEAIGAEGRCGSLRRSRRRSAARSEAPWSIESRMSTTALRVGECGVGRHRASARIGDGRYKSKGRGNEKFLSWSRVTIHDGPRWVEILRVPAWLRRAEAFQGPQSWY